MTEQTILLTTISMKVDALEAVLSLEQLETYRKILQDKKKNFMEIWGKYLSPERLEEALISFEI